MDGDNDLDIVQSIAGSTDVVRWLENDGAPITGSGGSYFQTSHQISTTGGVDNPESIDIGDLDGNSTPDVVATIRGSDEVYIWMNAAGGTSWTEQLGTASPPWCKSISSCSFTIWTRTGTWTWWLPARTRTM